MTYQQHHKKRWSSSDIRSARQMRLKPILENLGYRLVPLRNDNYEVAGITESVVIKDNFWLDTDNNSSGNSIDFFTKILGMSFQQAMGIIMEGGSYDVNGKCSRSVRGKTGGFRQS